MKGGWFYLTWLNLLLTLDLAKAFDIILKNNLLWKIYHLLPYLINRLRVYCIKVINHHIYIYVRLQTLCQCLSLSVYLSPPLSYSPPEGARRSSEPSCRSSRTCRRREWWRRRRDPSPRPTVDDLVGRKSVSIMVLIFSGSLEYDTHVLKETSKLICLRHLFNLTTVSNLISFGFSFTRGQLNLSYHLI